MTESLIQQIKHRYMNGAEALDGNPLAAAYRADVGYLLSQHTEPSQDVVERVAKEICDHEWDAPILDAKPTGIRKTKRQYWIEKAKAAIAAMGTEKAVKNSTEQEEFGTAPEAAGLEPKCNQPVPAQSEISDVAPTFEQLIRVYHMIECNFRKLEHMLYHYMNPTKPVSSGCEHNWFYKDSQQCGTKILDHQVCDKCGGIVMLIDEKAYKAAVDATMTLLKFRYKEKEELAARIIASMAINKYCEAAKSEQVDDSCETAFDMFCRVYIDADRPAREFPKEEMWQAFKAAWAAAKATKRESVGHDFMLEAQSTLINVRQLLSGWHQDGTAWSEWDRSVEAAVGNLQLKIEEYLNAK